MNERPVPGRITIQDGHFSLGGRPLWLNAANTPWHRWNDFGGRFEPDFWDAHFARLHTAGVNATRIWINCGGIAGVLLGEDGRFEGVTDAHWHDLDMLFSLADKHHVYIMATLLSFDHCKENPRATHLRWRQMICSEAHSRAFAEGYVVPFVQRYGTCPHLFSIDLMNEPDWVAQNPECGTLPWDDLTRFFGLCAAAIHRHSPVLVTVGMGLQTNHSDRLAGDQVSDARMTALSGDPLACLDFYSPHYYEWERSRVGYPYTMTPEEFGLLPGRPAVIGECAAVDETGVPLAQRYESAWRSGWDGVFVWTANGVDKCGGFDDMLPAVTRMRELAPESVNIDR